MGKRVFEERKINAKGLVVSKEDFRLFLDLDGYSYNEERMAKVIESAEAMLEEQIPFLPLSLYREFSINGNRTNYQTKVNRRKTMAMTLTLAEHYEKKGRFIDKLIDVLWAMMEESTWVYPAHASTNPVVEDLSVPPVFGDAIHGVALCSAGGAAAVAVAYHLLKDEIAAVSPVITDKMVYTLRERMIKPFLNVTFWWTGFTKRRPNNWCPWIISNMLYVTAVTESDPTVREQVVSRALRCLDEYMDALPADGGCDEGPGYWGAAGGSLFDCLELIYDITGGRISVFDHPHVKNIGEYIVKVNLCDKYYVNFADGSSKNAHDGKLFMRFGSRCGSEALYTLGQHLAASYDAGLDYSKIYRTLRSVNTPKPEDCEVVALPCSLLPSLGVMVARESTNPAKGTVLALKGGHNAESHNHNDVGNFIVYRNGNPVLIDVGVGAYTKQTFSADRYKIWSMQSGYHNLPSFGGVDQKNGAAYTSENCVWDPDGKSARVGITKAYPAEAGIVEYYRDYKLEGAVATVTDSFTLLEEKEVDLHLMTCREPTASGDGVIALCEDMELLYDPSLTAEIEAVDPVGMDTKSKWDTDILWRIHLKTVAREGSLTVTVRPRIS